jgi:hypothetical protein
VLYRLLVVGAQYLKKIKAHKQRREENAKNYYITGETANLLVMVGEMYDPGRLLDDNSKKLAQTWVGSQVGQIRDKNRIEITTRDSKQKLIKRQETSMRTLSFSMQRKSRPSIPTPTSHSHQSFRRIR